MFATTIFIITIYSCISSIIICFCFKYCKDRRRQIDKQNKLNNAINKAFAKIRIKPIIEMKDEELNYMYELRYPQITGDQSV